MALGSMWSQRSRFACFTMLLRRLFCPPPKALLAPAALFLLAAPLGDADLRPRVSVCFAPGTPLDTQAARKSAVAQFQVDETARWSRTATDGAFLRRGEPTTLTWSVVADGTPIPGYVGEASAASNLRTWLTIKYGSESQWRPLFERVFDRWSEVSGVTFVHESQDDGSTLGDLRGSRGVRADIRIGGHRIDGTNGTLAYAFFPDDGDMVLDTSDRWFDTVANDSRRLRNVVAHENGHGMGLDHVCPVNGTKLMEPTTSTAIDGPQLDDVLAVQRLYGDRFEDDESQADAADLGLLRPGQTLVADVSIDGANDTDVYAFRAPDGARVDLSLVPIGAAYLQGPQNVGGSCSDGATYDSLRRADLSLELLAPDGRRLAVADAAPEGVREEIVGVPLVSTGTHHVRVRGDRDDVQLYRLVIDVLDPATRPTAEDDDAVTDDALPVRIDVLANDSGVSGSAITVAVVDQPSGGTARAIGRGVLRYAPDRGFAGRDAFTYRVRDAAGNDSTATVRVVVTRTERAGDARTDTDGDGFPDELETRLGTSPASASSRPAAPPGALAPSAAKLRLRFRKDGRDGFLLRGALPLRSTAAHGDAVVYVAGLVRTFSLDGHGRGATTDGDALRVGSGDGSTVPFKLRLRGARLAAALADEGFRDEDGVRKEARDVTVIVIAAGEAFSATLPLRLSVRRGRGKAKLVRD